MPRPTSQSLVRLLPVLLVAACTATPPLPSGGRPDQPSAGDSTASAQPSVPPTPATSVKPAAPDFLACALAVDGGPEDKHTNADVYAGLARSNLQRRIRITFERVDDEDEAAQMLERFVSDGCDLVVGVGPELASPLRRTALANRDVPFAIVDHAYAPAMPNVVGITFRAEEAAVLAGYAAAGMTKSGRVGALSDVNRPHTAVVLDGLAAGIEAYNQRHGTRVSLIGWSRGDPEAGWFTGDPTDRAGGKELATRLIAEGADVVVPIAGEVGLGAGSAVQEAGDVMLIGFGPDQYLTAVEYGNVTLTTIVRQVDDAVHEITDEAIDGSFRGGEWVGTLANGGVGLAPWHDFSDDVPQPLKDEVSELAAAIADGRAPLPTIAAVPGGADPGAAAAELPVDR